MALAQQLVQLDLLHPIRPNNFQTTRPYMLTVQILFVMFVDDKGKIRKEWMWTFIDHNQRTHSRGEFYETRAKAEYHAMNALQHWQG